MAVVDTKDGVAILSPLVWGNTLHAIIFEKEHKVLSITILMMLMLTCIYFAPQYLTPEKFFILCLQICQAIVYLHSAEPPLAHLDIKPANIMVSIFFFNRLYNCILSRKKIWPL